MDFTHPQQLVYVPNRLGGVHKSTWRRYPREKIPVESTDAVFFFLQYDNK